MGNIFYPKKIFLEKTVKNPCFNYNIKEIKIFENGNILIQYGYSRIVILDINFEFAFNRYLDSNISCLSIINNQNFIIAERKGIFLYYESFEENSIPENNNYDLSMPLIGEKTYKYKIIKDNIIARFILYNKDKNELFILNEEKILIYDINIKNKILFLKATLKIKDCLSFIYFNNRFIIAKINHINSHLLCYDGRKMNQIPKLKIINHGFDSKINLYNYNNKYFLYTECTEALHLLYVYDFYNKVIIRKIDMSFEKPSYINITKNYFLVSDIVSLYIYDRKTLNLLQIKRLLLNECFLGEMNDGKIGVFRSDNFFVYSKDKIFKIIFFAFIRFLFVFLFLYSLIRSLYLEKLGVWYVIKNFIKLDIIYFVLFHYNNNNKSRLYPSQFY